MISQRRDYYAGALIILIGLLTAYLGSQYKIGTLTRMGPGYFPAVLGVLLAATGILIALSRPTAAETADHLELVGPPDWRGRVCIVAGVMLFVVLARYAGLLPAAFACVFVSALGDRNATWKSACLLALAVTLFGVVLFTFILGVQIPILKGF